MNCSLRVLVLLVAWVILVCPISAQAVTLQLVAQLDTASLNAGVPGSIAAYGNNVYIGNLFPSGLLHHITDPLGTPVNAQTFGGSIPAGSSNGYVSLNTDGTTLIAATNNGGAVADIVQVYTVGSNALNWAGDSSPGSLNITGDRIDGAAVDPQTGNLLITAYGSGNQHLFQSSSPIPPVPAPTPSVLFDTGVGTGWRDIDFDNASGDIVLRAVNGVARGRRNGPDDYVKLDGSTAGIQTIVNKPDGFNSAINVEFLPIGFAGQELVIMNHRNSNDTFVEQVLVYDANAVDQPIATTFLSLDGSPFTTTAANSGIYDFSYDPIVNLLYISDYSTSQVHVFQFVPEPCSILLALGFAGVALIRWRRR